MHTVCELVIHIPEDFVIAMLGMSLFFHRLNMKAISLCSGGLRFTEVMQAEMRDYGCEVSGNVEIHLLRRS